jgi:transcription initiation factor TFIIIB Brf1 subunit/transcription initiation factor TFIIB
MDVNEVWKEFERSRQESLNHVSTIDKCKSCESSDIIYEDANVTCRDCGLIQSESLNISEYSYEKEVEPTNFRKCASSSSKRIIQMQEWYMWTNSEKNDYKLNKYAREFCEKLGISENVMGEVCSMVVKIMNAIRKRNDGPKRSKVKDGIIVACIYYVSKNDKDNSTYSYIDLAKKIDLDIKYVSKADKIIMELMNFNKENGLNIDKRIITQTERPIDYVSKIVEKYNLQKLFSDSDMIMKHINILISICEDNDLLIDHTPLSIGVTCFYYILELNNIEIDVRLFSEMYDLSVVTVIKTYGKLKIHKEKIDKMIKNS